MEEKEVEQYRRKFLIVIAVILFVFTAVALVTGTLLAQSLLSIKQDTPKQEQVRIDGMYPNPVLTPGDVFSGATKEIICVVGYTKTVRDVSNSLKKKIYEEYNVIYPQPTGAYEVDHFIPLALGGSNDAKNLWLEAAEPRPGFHEKDVVEVYLLDQVCHHNLDLKKAQDEVRLDWFQVYKSIPNKGAYIY